MLMRYLGWRTEDWVHIKMVTRGASHRIGRFAAFSPTPYSLRQDWGLSSVTSHARITKLS